MTKLVNKTQAEKLQEMEELAVWDTYRLVIEVVPYIGKSVEDVDIWDLIQTVDFLQSELNMEETYIPLHLVSEELQSRYADFMTSISRVRNITEVAPYYYIVDYDTYTHVSKEQVVEDFLEVLGEVLELSVDN